MALRLENLDATTRRYMLEELDRNIAAGTLYYGTRLSEGGRQEWPSLLRTAFESGTDETLATALESAGRLVNFETSRTRTGQVIEKRVPVNAAETLAEGEFNRFYARGVCRRALAEDIPEVVIYRAKEVRSPRAESQRMLGGRISAEALLNDLRTAQGVEPALHLPPGPNSGLSVRLP